MKYLISLAFLLYPALIFSQVIYQTDDYAEQGESFQLSIANSDLLGVDFEETGADFSWDFSDLGFDDQTLVSIIDPNDGGYKITWCFLNGYILNCNDKFDELTNRGLIDENGAAPIELPGATFSDVVNHQRLTTDALELTMIGTTIDLGGFPLAVPFDYVEPDTVMLFPVEFGGTSSTSSRFEIDLNDFGFDLTYRSSATRNNTVDGWGAIETPYDSYPNTVRVYSEIERNDTLNFMGIELPIPTTQIEVKWLDPDFGTPVFQANGISVLGFTVFNEIRYIDTVQCIGPQAFFFAENEVIWNPDTQQGLVAFSNNSQNADFYEWDFGDNGASIETDPEYGFACPGEYNVTLQAYADCAPLEPDEFEFTITVTDTTDYFSSSVDLEICEGDSILLGDDYQSVAGTYSFTIPSFAGCDSMVTVNLSLYTVNSNVVASSEVLEAEATGASYQWVDCENGNAAIPGATEQVFEPTISGSYAAEVTQDGCTATSECFAVMVVGTKESTLLLNSLELSPNPFTDELDLRIQPVLTGMVRIEIIDPLGRILFAERQEGLSNHKLDLSTLPSGLYWLRISLGEQLISRAIQKQ